MDTKLTNTNLYIPANIKTRVEIVPGFGWKEFGITLATGAIALGIAILLHILTARESIMQGIFIVTTATFAAFVVTRKDDFNRSVMDSVRILIQFSSEQQKFKYIYRDPFRPN